MASSTGGAADQALRQRYTGTPIQISVTTSASTAQVLSQGRYRVVADADMFVLQGDSGVAGDLSSTSKGHYLPAGVVDYIIVDDEDDTYISAIMASGTGTLYVSPQR